MSEKMEAVRRECGQSANGDEDAMVDMGWIDDADAPPDVAIAANPTETVDDDE